MPQELSGGQQQRVAFARALVIEPAILLLDEPLSNLDAKLRDELRGEIRDIQTRLGITALFVTHDQAEALTMSDRIAVMNHGRIEQIGTPTEIYERPASLFVAGFVGRTNRLLATVDRSRPDYFGPVANGLRFAARRAVTPPVTRHVIIRPHRMRLSRSPRPYSENINECPPSIRRIVFAGDVMHYDADAAGTSLLVETPTSSAGRFIASRRGTVFVHWPVSDTLVFAQP